MENVYNILGELDILNKHCKDILESRIEDVLNSMSSTTLCTLPEDEAVSVDEFLKLTEDTCNAACSILVKLVQSSMFLCYIGVYCCILVYIAFILVITILIRLTYIENYFRLFQTTQFFRLFLTTQF